MREKYETLPLATLRALAKSVGLKGVSSLRKPELIDRLMELEDKEQEGRVPEKPVAEKSATNVPETKMPERDSEKPAANVSENKTQETMQGKALERTQERTPEIVRERSQERILERTQERTPERSPEKNEREFSNRYPYMERRVQRPDRADRPDRTDRSDRTDRPDRADRPDRPDRADRPDREPPMPENLEKAKGILEVMMDGYGFLRGDNFLSGENDVYVSPSQIRRFNLKTGDVIRGNIRTKGPTDKNHALMYVESINGLSPYLAEKRDVFEFMTPTFPNSRLRLEREGGGLAMRIVDLISPIGKGQRGMIVSPPKAGKTTLLKQVAKSILQNNPETYLIILLIDERPEEVTDIREAINGERVDVIYSTFDEQPENHRRVAEMVIERAKRLVEHHKDVVLLLDSITRLARAYNLIVPASGRTLSGGLDPAALHPPKRFFGAARNMKEGGSLTILATALVDTGSKMDDVIYEEFKGTGNMELVLDRKLQERRVFPAIDIQKSGTRREDLLLTRDELDAVYQMRRSLNSLRSEEATEQILNLFSTTKSNAEFVNIMKKQKP